MGEAGARPAGTQSQHVRSAEEELARRILASETLRRSGRLKELLVYLLARTAEAPHNPVREHEIGTSVYARRPDYDTSHDTIVRVQVAQLRKKLELYYQTEGAGDEMVLTIPRGSYHAVWRPRSVEPAARIPEPVVAPSPRSFWLPVLTLAVVVLLALSAVLFKWVRPGPGESAPGRQALAVTKFWSQLLIPGKTTHIVLSDPGIVMLAQATGRPIRFPELGDRLFLSRIESMKAAPEVKSLMRNVTAAQLTTLSDVEIVRRITALGLFDQGMLSIVAARDFRIRDLNSNNTVLIGYGLSNPWVEVFQHSINFVLDRDRERNRNTVMNRQPQAGEQARYDLGDPQISNPAQGYATVAFLPNPTVSGKVLIISGADVPGTEAAIRFLMSEGMWRPFAERLSKGGEMPPFEVLLAYRRLSNSSGDVSPVAWRVKE